MEKIDSNHPLSKSKDLLEENVETLKRLFPEVVTEGKIDKDALLNLLGDFPENESERFSFTWNGKQQARREAQKPSTGTLRPCREESVNFDSTQNLYIEGDNLEVLKLLQKSYHGKVKMIYIDPPYNTGNDFIYNDDYTDNLQHYLELTGQTDAEGKKLSTNSDASGRYHSNWLNMMYPRLKLARNLLKEDGVIFVSIDDNEVQDLRLLMNEVFGEGNFITTVIWQRVYSPKNSAKYFSEDHDYVMVFAKNAEVWRPELLPRSAEANARYKNIDDDARGPWKPSDLTARNYYSEGLYEVTSPSGKKFRPNKGTYWRCSFENFLKLDEDNRVWWGPNGDAMPAQKRFLSEVKQGITPQTMWFYKDVGHTQEAKKELLKYVDFEETANVLNSVKPVRLIRRMLQIGTTKENPDIVLDFFSGSGPTAHGVLTQNVEDSGKRKFILVQLPEPLPKPEEKVKTIADLAKSRIRNVIKELEGKDLDLGFKVLQLDSSNIKSWDPDYDQLEETLFNSINNIKPDRSEEDLLHEVLLKFGLDLSLPIQKQIVGENVIYDVGMGALMVCLSKGIQPETIETIGKIKEERAPETCRVVFIDSGFKNDAAKTNALQILKRFGITEVRSI